MTVWSRLVAAAGIDTDTGDTTVSTDDLRALLWAVTPFMNDSIHWALAIASDCPDDTETYVVGEAPGMKVDEDDEPDFEAFEIGPFSLETFRLLAAINKETTK